MVKKRTKQFLGSLLSASLVVLMLGGCSAGKPTVTPSAEGVNATVVVRVVDNSYDPKTVTIRAGEAVTWELQGMAKHDVVAKDGSFVSELMREGTFTHVFDEPGEYEYDCSVHPEMSGKVIVEEG